MIPDDPSEGLWADGDALHRYCFTLPSLIFVAWMCDTRVRVFGRRRYVDEARQWLCGMRDDIGECAPWLIPRFPVCYVPAWEPERLLLCDLLALARRPEPARILESVGPPHYHGRHLWWDAMLDEGYQPVTVQTAPLVFMPEEDDL